MESNDLLVAATIFMALCTLAIAFYTARAANAAGRAAEATKDSVRAQLFQQLMSEYSSTAMEEALTHLGGYVWGPGGLKQWGRQVAEGEHQGARLENQHRRIISHFFVKVARIVEQDLLAGDLSDELTSLAGVNVLFNVVVPMNSTLAHYIGQEAKNDATRALLERVYRPKGNPVVLPHPGRPQRDA